MQSAGRGLDEVVDLLGRWGGAAGPADRLQVVTEAARVLRDLPSTDSRVLARQLFEHGAPNAAQKIAQQTGGAVSADQLNDAAYALLSVDRDELDGLAQELRDPQQRREVFERAGVAMAAAAGGMGHTAPPDPTTRQHLPPPPGASRSSAVAPSADPPTPPVSMSESPTPGSPDADARAAAEPDASGAPDLAPQAGSEAAPESAPESAPEIASESAPEAAPRSSPESASRSSAPVPARRSRSTPMSRFVDQLADAPNGRERLALLGTHQLQLDHQQLVEVLQAVPDGWQRRTVLRRLLAARRIDPLDDASQVVALFARRGDRFAAAAALTRSGRADVVPLLAELDPADARRLRRRYAPSR